MAGAHLGAHLRAHLGAHLGAHLRPHLGGRLEGRPDDPLDLESNVVAHDQRHDPRADAEFAGVSGLRAARFSPEPVLTANTRRAQSTPSAATRPKRSDAALKELPT